MLWLAFVKHALDFFEIRGFSQSQLKKQTSFLWRKSTAVEEFFISVLLLSFDCWAVTYARAAYDDEPVMKNLFKPT